MIQTGSCKKKILVVEDEPIVGRLYRRVLSAKGFNVDVAQNGQTAFEAATNKNYDLCVSDIRLPGITGIQLYELSKAHSPQLSRRMIFMTGDTMSANIQLFLQQSGIPCSMKPFSPEELVAAMREIKN
jgi:DNA-binding response OmpR family regulator